MADHLDEFLNKIRERMTGEGQVKHGDYKTKSPDYYEDRKNHLIAHLEDYMNGELDDEHLVAIASNALILDYYEQNKTDVHLHSKTSR